MEDELNGSVELKDERMEGWKHGRVELNDKTRRKDAKARIEG